MTIDQGRSRLTAKRMLIVVSVVFAFLLGGLLGSLTKPGLVRGDQDLSGQQGAVRNVSFADEPWDSRDIRRSAVLHDGCLYRMWYGGTDSSHSFRIGYALSEDGARWIRYSSDPVLEPGGVGEWDARSVWDPSVLATATGYLMWYVGQDARGRIGIGLAESVDGIEWTKCPCNPVLSGDAETGWEARGVDQPTVIFDGTAYRMWYRGLAQDSSTPSAIGYATSTDGRVWEKHAQNPVLTADPELSWERRGVLEPAVLYKDSLFEMWYAGIAEGGIEGIGYASSVDGLHWTKHSDNPVLLPRSVETWESLGVFSPAPVYVEDLVHLWYFGSDIKADGRKVHIGFAVSNDGLHWTRNEGNPVFTVTSGGKYQNP